MTFQACVQLHPEFIPDPKWYNTNEMEHFTPFFKLPLQPLQQDELWSSWNPQELGALYRACFVTHDTLGLWESGLNYGLLWVWSSKHFKHRSVLLRGVGVGQTESFRSRSILPGPRLRPHCACWQAGHIARIHSINVLLAPFPHTLNAGKWQVHRQTRLAQCLTVWTAGTCRLTGFTQWW